MAEDLASSSSTPLQIPQGTLIGRYKVVEKIGEGGMGQVYRAHDTLLDRPVAIKRVAHRAEKTKQQKDSLLREARAISALNHPHIAQVYDVIELHDELFIVMEYVEGRSLRGIIQERPKPAEALRILIACARALAAAHEKGIVHRDIKPENVMITEDGQVKLLDFGIARRIPSQETPTMTLATGGVQGTVAYLAPEVLQSLAVDPRVDIFSLGVVLYELLTGTHPYHGLTNSDGTVEIPKGPPPPPSQLVPNISTKLDEVVLRMIALNPGNRYASIGECLNDLLQAYSSLEGETPRFLGSGPLVSRRRPTVFAAMERYWSWILVFLLTAALGIILSRSQRLQEWLGLRPVPETRHLAILPFTYSGMDKQQAAVCAGLAEELAGQLTQMEPFFGKLWVVPMSDVRQLGVSSARTARGLLNTNLVITGSCQADPATFRVILNLVDANSLRQKRSRLIQVPAASVSQLYEQTIEQAMEMLDLELNPAARSWVAQRYTPAPDAQSYFLQGRAYLERYENPDNLQYAIDLFRKALDLDPKFTRAHTYLARAYLRMYETDPDVAWLNQARTSARRAFSLQPKAAEVLVTRAMIARETGAYEEALKDYQQALEINPRDMAAQRGLATVLETMGRPEEAENAYKAAIRMRPDYWSGYNYLGVFYFQNGRYAEAAEMFRRVIELSPDNLRGYYNLGACYFNLGEFAQAETAFRHSLSIRPTRSGYLNLGTLYFFQKRYQDAAQMYEKAIDLGAHDYRTWAFLGDAYRYLPDHKEKAHAAYQQALDLAQVRLAVNPDDMDTRSWVALFLAYLGRKDDAVAEIEHALSERPESPRIHLRYILVLELTGQRQRALQALNRALKLGIPKEEFLRHPDLEGLRSDPAFPKQRAASTLSQQ